MHGRGDKTSLLDVASNLGKIEPNNVAFVDKVLALARSDRGIRHPLNHRLRLANQLANSILYVHLAQFVHKHVAPENILLLTRAGANKRGSFPYALGDPFLVGFDRTRAEQAISTGRGEMDIADCIYHHPERWGRTAGMRFSMLHDVYSLGVVLLEIALWDSLVVWLHKEFGFPRERFIAWKFIRDMFDEKAGSLKDGITAEDVQEALIRYAKHHIPLIMGEGYTNVVISCLSGDFKVEKPDRFQDGGIGFVYMINVISKLEKLQLS
jgi:serine/threonine protein kinase